MATPVHRAAAPRVRTSRRFMARLPSQNILASAALSVFSRRRMRHSRSASKFALPAVSKARRSRTRRPKLPPGSAGVPPALSFLSYAARAGGTPALPALRRPRFALDLGAMHDAPRTGVERVAPVHGAAIVPQHQIADAPHVLPGELRPRHVAPQLIEQGFGGRELQPGDVGVAAT